MAGGIRMCTWCITCRVARVGALVLVVGGGVDGTVACDLMLVVCVGVGGSSVVGVWWCSW